MRALVVTEHDVPPAIMDIPKPQPGPGDWLIKVTACGLNFADLLMVKGSYQGTPALPFALGLEVSGRVVALGQNAAPVQIGQRVAAYVQSGGLAEFVSVPSHRCLPLPDTMDDATAAGFQIAYGTSHLALEQRARLHPGETLAVLGAAGGVGLTAVEIGRAMGARVIAVARSKDKLKVATAAGADEVLLDTCDLRMTLRGLGGIDVLYDPVGGPAAEAAARALKPLGRHLVIGFASGGVPPVKLNHLMVKNIDVLGVNWGGYLQFAPAALTQSLRTLVGWHSEGRLHPHISHRLPFDQALDGLALLRDRQATGKVVIEI